MTSDKTPAAIWLRVSTDEQHAENQRPALEKFCTHHGLDVVKVYELDDSAWNGGKDGGLYQRTLKQTMDDAWKGEFSVVVVWALDRITRGGAEDMLRLVRKYRECGCTLLSVQEPWLNSSPEIQDVLVAFAGWNAQQESKRRSQRVKLAVERRRAAGLPVGRPAGAKDKKTRSKLGYHSQWAPGGKRREATR
jgi:DNA invertase Pin-like site-specific DNA recombinase